MSEDAEGLRAEAVRALESEFGELFSRFRRLIAESAQRVSPGLLPGAYKVFTTIVRRAPVTASALSDSLMVDKAQVSRMVRELEGLGLVERAADPHDRRSSLLSPTAEGLARLQAVRAPNENALSEAVRGWDVDDIRTLARLLHALGGPDRES